MDENVLTICVQFFANDRYEHVVAAWYGSASYTRIHKYGKREILRAWSIRNLRAHLFRSVSRWSVQVSARGWLPVEGCLSHLSMHSCGENNTHTCKFSVKHLVYHGQCTCIRTSALHFRAHSS
jgi:hypothetical protein